MSTPSPYEVGSAISRNFTNSFAKARDTSAIDEILMKANQSGNPQDINVAMSEIIRRVSPERQGQALAVLQQKQSQIQQQQQQQQKRKAYEAAGIGQYLDVDPKIASQLIKTKQYDDQLKGILGNQNPMQPAMGNNLAPSESNSSDLRTSSMQPNQEGLNGLSNDQLIRLSGIPGPLQKPSELLLKQRQEDKNLTQRNFENKAKFHNDISKKVLERADAIAESLPQKQSALNAMNKSIQEGNLSYFSKDNLAELTGFEGLRSQEGALFKTAGKEYFLGNLSRAGSRPNQWIEQQISDMLAKIGRTPEANLTVTRALQNELDLENERVRLINEISNQSEKELGYIPRDLGTQVNERMQKYADTKEKEFFNDLRAIKSIAEGKPQKFRKVAEGTQVSEYMAQALLNRFNNDPQKAAEEAKKLGYVF